MYAVHVASHIWHQLWFRLFLDCVESVRQCAASLVCYKWDAVAAWDDDRALVKVNPVADWSTQDLTAYIAANNVPVNPLHARGFISIGCAPCTRAVQPGENPRAGRWWWEHEGKKECGLHMNPNQEGKAA